MPPPLERRISREHAGRDLAAAAAAVREAGQAKRRRVERRARRRSLAFMGVRSERRAVVPILSARDRSAPRSSSATERRTARRSAAGRKSGSRAAHWARRRCGERRVGAEAAHQRRQRGGVADREVAVVVGAEQADVAVDPARQHRHARAHRLDDDVGAAFHPAAVDQRARPRDRAPRRGVRRARRASGRTGTPPSSPALRRPGARRAAAPTWAIVGTTASPASRRAARYSVAGSFSSRRWPTATRSASPGARAARSAGADWTMTTALARLAASRRARPASCSTTMRLAHSSECRAPASTSRSR